MFSYMAVAWDVTDGSQATSADTLLAHARASGLRWQTVFNKPGICVLAKADGADGRWCLLADQAGIVLGTIFRKGVAEHESTPLTQASFGQSTTTSILKSGGRELIDSYWGTYVAILRDESATWVLRSPVGSLPCLHTTFRDVRIFFSYLPDVIRLRLIDFSVDWGFVASYLIKASSNNVTGFSEIAELAGGHCLKVRGREAIRQAYWDLHEIARRDAITNEAAAIHAVHDTTRTCVSAWASAHESVLLNLSGGLDSSIVLGCLAKSPHRSRVTGLTRYASGPNGDEREFARAAAEAAGCELVEFDFDEPIPLRAALQAEISETPQRYMPRIALSQFERKLARERAATAIFNGTRGDELFVTRSELMAADYISQRGIDRGLLEQVLHVARRYSVSVWTAARQAVYHGLIATEWDVLKERGQAHTLLTPYCLERANAALVSKSALPASHTRGVPIGKQQQIYKLQPPEAHYLPFAERGDPVPISPLLSQPLVETCVRIPTYIHSHSGWDRLTARRAFVEEVPEKILTRRSKGGVGDAAIRMLGQNRAFLRELLLNGALVQQGLLDRGKLEDALADHPSGVMKGTATILRYMNAEVWLSIWAERRRQLAA